MSIMKGTSINYFLYLIAWKVNYSHPSDNRSEETIHRESVGFIIFTFLVQYQVEGRYKVEIIGNQDTLSFLIQTHDLRRCFMR